MCELNNQFKLCSCSKSNTEIEHNKNSRRYKKKAIEQKSKKIIWTLSKYIGPEYIGMDGMLIGPVDKLNEKITADYVKFELNKHNCFDFEYTPKEGDYLTFTLDLTKKEALREDYKYLPFIFKKGKWTINSYNSFYDKTIELNKGKLKFK